MRKSFIFLPIFALLAACGSESDDSSLSGALQLPKYLALGDSISFGYTPLVQVTDENVAKGLFVGYPEFVAAKAELALTNASCAGETTASFIDSTAKDNGCHSGNDPRHDHLKVEYTGSQLDYAVKFLAANPDTQLVTVSIGGNDLLVTEDECNLESIPVLCKAARLPGVAFNFAKNLGHIVKTIKKSGYTGEIVLVTGYPRLYKDAIQKIALGLLNAESRAVALFTGVKVASGFETFEKASKEFDGDICKAGLSIDIGNGECNQHPSAKGHDVLANSVLDVLAK